MFLLNLILNILRVYMNLSLFTIQNVPIKFCNSYLEYLLLKTFTIQNVPIKLLNH